MQEDQNVYQGGCHCGNIRYRLNTALDWQKLVPRQCLCSFCMKHNNRYLSDPKARLDVEILKPETAKGYQFGQKFADFRVCNQCGVMPMVTTEIDGFCYAVININTLDDVDIQLPALPVDHSGERLDTRLQQCRDNWIADVTITGDS